MVESMLSVGIDIGTSTTQVIFSRLTMRNEASETRVPRIRIVKKEVIYQSPLFFTPLQSPTEIDADRVRELVRGEYDRAGISPEDLSTGAVIITGETARKENAEEVVRALAGLAGNFVVATAGPDLESVLSGRGAGTAKYSEDRGAVAVNLDVGGGTTNISVFSNGAAIDTGCLDIGGRLIRLNPDTGVVTYVAPKIKLLAESLGIYVTEGERINPQEISRICGRMAQVVEEAAGLRPATPWLEKIVTNHGIRLNTLKADKFTFSGGVADCIYSPENFRPGQFGDIGVELGRALRNSSFFEGDRTMRPQETIRATVVGAGNHSMELSGSTISYTEEDFPLRDIPVIKLDVTKPEDLEELPEKLRRQIAVFRGGAEDQEFAIGMVGFHNPDFCQVEAMADTLWAGMREELEKGGRLIVILEEDTGKALGQALKRRIPPKCRLICMDSVHVEDGDYVDIGKPVAAGRVLPVVVKTLIFI